MTSAEKRKPDDADPDALSAAQPDNEEIVELLEDEWGATHETHWLYHGEDFGWDAWCGDCTERNIWFCRAAHNRTPPKEGPRKKRKTKLTRSRQPPIPPAPIPNDGHALENKTLPPAIIVSATITNLIKSS